MKLIPIKKQGQKVKANRSVLDALVTMVFVMSVRVKEGLSLEHKNFLRNLKKGVYKSKNLCYNVIKLKEVHQNKSS